MAKTPDDAIRAVEHCVQALTPTGTNQWVLLNEVGGLACSRYGRCSSLHWRAIAKALKAGKIVGALEIDSAFQYLRLRDGCMSAAASNVIEEAARFAVAFVTNTTNCTLDNLSKAVVNEFGSAMWVLVKSAVVKNAEHPTRIRKGANGYLVVDSSSVAAPGVAPAAPAVVAPAAPAVAAPAAPYVLVNSTEICAAALAVLNRADAVGVDCEGSLDLDAHFFLRLVQVGVTTNHVFCAYIFDMKAADAAARNAIANTLRWLLQASTVGKVFHDLRRDMPALCRELQLHRSAVQSLLDTQVLFELLVDSALEPRRYAGARASLNDVLRACNLPVNEQKKQFQAAFDEAFWRELDVIEDVFRSTFTASTADEPTLSPQSQRPWSPLSRNQQACEEHCCLDSSHSSFHNFPVFSNFFYAYQINTFKTLDSNV
jgi:hypothetical protein